MRLVYIGAHDAVVVPLPSGIEVTVERGAECVVPDEHAKRLLEQEANWKPAAAPAAKKKGGEG